MNDFKWKTFRAGRMSQTKIATAADLEHLAELDRRQWLVVSMPIEGVRLDPRTLALIDTDKDGRIRFDEVLSAIDFLKKNNVDLNEVINPPDGLDAELAAVMARKDAGEEVENEERLIRYRLHLLELVENFVNLRRFYDPNDRAIFQTGTLRIDAREINLCFNVADAAAHAELAKHANCFILYLKLTRPSEAAERTIAAVVTTTPINTLYVGRNGVFTDRDGRAWEATVVQVLENPVSLAEAFCLPWRRVGEAVSSAFAKILGDHQAKAVAALTGAATKTDASAGGAAMASSVAAVGIGIGMVGAAAASLMAAVSRMTPLQLLASVAAIIALVSLPSVILTWFKLRRRDLGAVLNASGWAVNRAIRIP